MSVSASWAEPSETCSAPTTFSSFWVGLDGDRTNSAEQTGTDADGNGGAAVYQGWFEMFPNAPVFYDNPVEPGDAMSASVVAGGAFTLTLTDTTRCRIFGTVSFHGRDGRQMAIGNENPSALTMVSARVRRLTG